MKIAGARPIAVAEGERSARNMADETLVPVYVVNAAWSALTYNGQPRKRNPVYPGMADSLPIACLLTSRSRLSGP